MREENSNEYNVLEQGFTDQVFFLFLKNKREGEKEICGSENKLGRK